MPALTRRALMLAGSGAAGSALLAACGTEAEERSSDEDPALLGAALGAELTLGATAGELTRGGGEEASLAQQIVSASRARAEELRLLLADLDGEEPDAMPSEPGLEGLETAAERAIAAYREGIAFLSTEELRAVALRFAVPIGASLAAIRDELGEEPSPFAFVTGLAAEPYEVTSTDVGEE